MKQHIRILSLIFSLALVPAIRAEAPHHHDGASSHGAAKKHAGPNGGRIVTTTEPHYELFVMADRKVQITFLGDDGKGIALKDQQVSAIGGDRTKPTKLAFTKQGEVLVSNQPLPAGDMIPLVVQVKMSPDAKTATEKLTIDLADCPTCVHKEYACTCGH